MNFGNGRGLIEVGLRLGLDCCIVRRYICGFRSLI